MDLMVALGIVLFMFILALIAVIIITLMGEQ